MFKKIIAACLVIAFFIVGGAHFAAARETIRGLGVAGVKDPIDRMVRVFERNNPGIRVVTKEEPAISTIETIGKGVGAYTFGMITRPLDTKEKAAYPDIKTFLFAGDGVAIVVHPDNPIKGLTSAQIRDIYAGRITNWEQVGGKRGVITALTREVGSGQRLAVEGVVMRGEKVPVGRHRAIGSMGGMRTEVALDPSAIGYILITAVDKSVKALALDGQPATLENFKAGAYPIAIPFFLITKGDPKGATKTFIDYIMGTEGQAAVARQRLAPAAGR